MDYLKRCEAVIDLDAVSRNLENYKAYLSPGTELMCVVKASCFGHSD